MSEPEERVTIQAPPDAILAILGDPSALGRVLPGCESAEPLPDGRIALVLTASLGFLTVRADAFAGLADAGPAAEGSRSLVLRLEGRPRGFDGDFRVAVPMALAPGPAGTEVRYRVEAEATGALAMIGSAGLGAAFRTRIAELVANVEREAGHTG